MNPDLSNEEKEKFIVATAFIVKAALLAISDNIVGDKFIELCADIFWQVENDPLPFVHLEQLANEVDITPSVSFDELRKHLHKLECKCAAIRERLKNE